MYRLLLLAVLCPLIGLSVFADDPNCPAYPRQQRESDAASIKLERDTYAFSKGQTRAYALTRAHRHPSINFIDDYIFGKMAADGVLPAPLTNDAEFLRRVSLDITGQIPTMDQVQSFVLDPNPNKRMTLIESLIASPGYTDKWTWFFQNSFEVTSNYYNFIGITGRNLFYSFVRDFVANDRPYNMVVAAMISAAGDSYQSGPANFLVRGIQQGDPIQDTWDTITDRITTKFLGVKTECVSCHDGRRHLEEINLYLTGRRRQQFWGQSAFFSRTTFTQLPVDTFGQQWHFLINDRTTGSYTGAVDPMNPGPRPARSGGPYTPAYMFTGELPKSNNWRAELARMLTNDRQFARATVNYVWAHFFRYGIVDPPDGFDLARLDPRNPPPAPWTLQPSHPELLEALTDEFIRSNYSIKRLVRSIAQSNAYQLSSHYPGEWKPAYERYFAKHFPRRLSAEEIYDAMARATMTETPMEVSGFNLPVLYAVSLPDPTEPRFDNRVRDFLTNFGRGDWWQRPRSNETTVLQVLFLMNDSNVHSRTIPDGQVTTRASQVMQSGVSDADAINQLFLWTLGRWATAEEQSMLLKRKPANRVEEWLSDIQWSLLNKVEFIFNY